MNSQTTPSDILKVMWQSGLPFLPKRQQTKVNPINLPCIVQNSTECYKTSWNIVTNMGFNYYTVTSGPWKGSVFSKLFWTIMASRNSKSRPMKRVDIH